MSDWSEVFGAHGVLARGVAGFAPREAQRRMAEAVDRALAGGRHLAVEAGTGTGKTFAYLVPALYSGRRVVISTGTRNLQDQLYGRDLPMVCTALGRPVRTALLKGRANYLCRHRLNLALEDPDTRTPRADLARVADWAGVTESGDVAEVDGVDERSRVWPLVTSTVDNCLGSDCPSWNGCHVLRARRAAQAADVVVVNHHLLLADLALKEEGFGELLPGFEAVIVDEAHQLPDTAVQFFGVSVSGRAIQNLLRDVRLEAARTVGAAELEGPADRVALASRELRLALGRGTGRRDWPEVGAAVNDALDELAEALEALGEALAPLADASASLGRCHRRTRDLAVRLARIVDAAPAAGVDPVYGEDAGHDPDAAEAVPVGGGLRWVDVSAWGYTLHLTPFDVSGRLAAAFESLGCTWVFTSATLAVGANFTHFTDRLGLGDIDEQVLASPFDYGAQGLLYLPRGLPQPSSPDYTAAVVDAALPLLVAAGGRAFVLFTSHRALAEARTRFEPHARREGFTLLVQGEAPKRELLEHFRSAPRPVLLGTASFWEGVDVRGEALKLVVIDKLPFAAPSDPLLRARIDATRARGGDPFRDVQLPQAVLALKQGVGRLIRDTADTGVVMLCDPRLTGRGYGRVFLQALPPFRHTASPDDAAAFVAAEGTCVG